MKVCGTNGLSPIGMDMDPRKREIRCIPQFVATLLHGYTVWETGTRHGEIQCIERVFTHTKLSNSKSYVHAVGSEVKSCSALRRPGRRNGLVLECTLDPVVWNDVVDFASGESMTQNTKIHSTLIECPLYANVELLMILVDVPMQTCIFVMDEVAKLFEHVETGSPKASTVTPSVTATATVPGPVGNIMHDGLDGSRWDLCCPKDMAVKKKKLWGYCYCVSRSSSQVCQGMWS